MVFHLCEPAPGVGYCNYHYLISAYEEFEDEEQLPTGSTDEGRLFWGQWEHCKDSYAKGSANVPWLVFFTGMEKPKGLPCSSWRLISHGHSFAVFRVKQAQQEMWSLSNCALQLCTKTGATAEAEDKCICTYKVSPFQWYKCVKNLYEKSQNS